MGLRSQAVSWDERQPLHQKAHLRKSGVAWMTGESCTPTWELPAQLAGSLANGGVSSPRVLYNHMGEVL